MLGPNANERAMGEDVEQLKQQIPLLEYLLQWNWTARRSGSREEFVGLCPLHQETHPSFYVNTRKNLFYCHGCGQGGDLIRFVELSLHLSFRQSVAHMKQELASAPISELLEQTAAFYRLQLDRHPEAVEYLNQRGLHDLGLIEELGIGYAAAGNLHRHLTGRGYCFHRLFKAGLINDQGRDAFYRRVIFPCREQGRIINFYGRSIGAAFPHRLLPRSKGGLFAWESVGRFSSVILAEGLFDLAVLCQSGFRNTTCAIGTHLSAAQLAQLGDRSGRSVYMAFDQDPNQAGQQAAHRLARRLESAGVSARIVALPPEHDPNSYFVAGATASDFARWWLKDPSRWLAGVNESTLLDYVGHQLDQEPQPTPQTINHRLGVVRLLYRFHHGGDIPSGQSHLQRTCRKRSPLGYGLRCCEVLDLQLEDLQLSEVQIRVLGKGNKKRVLPLPAEAVEVLQNYLRLERPLTNSPSLFVSLKGRQRGQPMNAAGLRSLFRYHRLRSRAPHANPHRFRHTFGADMVRAGISLPALQHLMGDSQIHTTMLYVQLAPQHVWREYARAVEKRTRLFPPDTP